MGTAKQTFLQSPKSLIQGLAVILGELIVDTHKPGVRKVCSALMESLHMNVEITQREGMYNMWQQKL